MATNLNTTWRDRIRARSERLAALAVPSDAAPAKVADNDDALIAAIFGPIECPFVFTDDLTVGDMLNLWYEWSCKAEAYSHQHFADPIRELEERLRLTKSQSPRKAIQQQIADLKAKAAFPGHLVYATFAGAQEQLNQRIAQLADSYKLTANQADELQEWVSDALSEQGARPFYKWTLSQVIVEAVKATNPN